MGMSARPQNLETVYLVLEILKRIPKRGQISAPELHKQLEAAGMHRDLRTIQRQLDELALHFDIDRNITGKPYGYRWKPQSTGFAIQQLSESQALLLTLAEQYLSSLLPAAVIKSMEGFFDEARSTLRYGEDERTKQSKAWLKKVRVVSTSQPLKKPTIKDGIFEAVSNALYANLWLDIVYKNAGGGTTKARVMPLGLAQQGVRLFLIVRFEGFENERSLAIHRLQSATASASKFIPPKGFSLEKFDDDGRFGFGEGKRVKLSFVITEAAGFHLLETPLSDDQIVTVRADGSYQINATVVKTSQLEWWLRGFGDAVSEIKNS
jgi:hypothetical protein